MEPIDPTEDMEKQPWLRFLPDFWKLPVPARIIIFVLLLMLGPTLYDACATSSGFVDESGEPVRLGC